MVKLTFQFEFEVLPPLITGIVNIITAVANAIKIILPPLSQFIKTVLPIILNYIVFNNLHLSGDIKILIQNLNA
jgi:hypothetical protein